MPALGDAAPQAIPALTLPGLLLVLIGLVLRAVITGAWMPRKTVDALLSARDAEIRRSNDRGDEWHAAYETERHRADLLADQNHALIEVAKTVEHVMTSLESVKGDASP